MKSTKIDSRVEGMRGDGRGREGKGWEGMGGDERERNEVRFLVVVRQG